MDNNLGLQQLNSESKFYTSYLRLHTSESWQFFTYILLCLNVMHLDGTLLRGLATNNCDVGLNSQSGIFCKNIDGYLT